MALTRPAIGGPENKVGMQDEIDAIRFAAEQGDAKAQSNLMYLEGRQDIPKATQKPRCPRRRPGPNRASASGWESESASRSALR